MMEPTLFLAQSAFVEQVDKVARTPLSTIIIFAAVLTVVRMVMHPYLLKIEPHRRTVGGYVFAMRANEFFDALIYAAVLIFLVVRPFLFQAFSVPSESMVKTLLIGDFIGINKAIYRYTDPKVGDIVVFRPPVYAVEPDKIGPDGQPKIDFIKRCVGGPGDLIEVKAGKLFRNGVDANETFTNGDSPFDWKLIQRGEEFVPVALRAGAANDPTMVPIAAPFVAQSRADMAQMLAATAVKIPPGHYLMMGDNRGASFDGRSWGLIKRDQVVGRCDFIWLPLSRIRGTR